MPRVMLTCGNMGFGGIERQISYLSRGLAQRDVYKPVICCLYDRGQLGGLAPEVAEAGIPILHCARGRQSWWSYARSFAKILRKQRIDILQVNRFPNLTAQLVAARLAGTPATVLRSPGAPHRLHRRLLSASKMCLRTLAPVGLVDCHIANSSASKSLVELAALFGRKRVRVIPNGVDTAFFGPRKVPKHEARMLLGLPADALVVGYAGNLFPTKGTRTLIRAAAQVAASCPQIVFALAGSHRDHLAALKAEARALAVEDSIAFLGWVKDVRVFYSAIDVLAFPSFSEGFPNVVLEAMASGLPVIGSDNPGVVEALGDAGRTVPVGDPEALAAAILEIISDPGLMQQMSRRGLERAKEFSPERMVDAYEAVYREVLEGKGLTDGS